MKNYISIISNEARLIDPEATPCIFEVIVSAEEDPVFRYWDTASSRANIIAVSAKLAMGKIAIIGLGGTGSYLFDLVTKTPVREIHLFDGDTFNQHNAFRAPGAASIEDLEKQPAKVDYFAHIYSVMRTGIFPHKVYLTDNNITELSGFDFVFLCVDKGPVRKLVSEFLRAQGIPFIDVGMELSLVADDNCLIGTCRATLITQGKSDHFDKRIPQGEDHGNDLYQTNIQVADMNALNANLAVIKWKQYCGFYQDIFKAYHTTYSVNAHSLTRDESDGPAEEWDNAQ